MSICEWLFLRVNGQFSVRPAAHMHVLITVTHSSLVCVTAEWSSLGSVLACALSFDPPACRFAVRHRGTGAEQPGHQLGRRPGDKRRLHWQQRRLQPQPLLPGAAGQALQVTRLFCLVLIEDRMVEARVSAGQALTPAAVHMFGISAI
jgi:hypothetical protein